MISDERMVILLGTHLKALCNHPVNWEDRYNVDEGRPCPGCYDARDLFEKWMEQKSLHV